MCGRQSETSCCVYRTLTAGPRDKLWALMCPTRNSQDTDEPLSKSFQQLIYTILSPTLQLHAQLKRSVGTQEDHSAVAHTCKWQLCFRDII